MLAALILAELIRRGRADIAVESAGTTTATIGWPAHENAVIVMGREFGLDISNHRARWVGKVGLKSFTHVICLSPEHEQFLFGHGVSSKVVIEVACFGEGIIDPHGGSIEVYRLCAITLELEARRLCDKFLETL